MKCPACGRGPIVHKCDKCGDIRCTDGSCIGTIGGKKGSASKGSICNACKKGHYEKIS
ncbi:MAG: hypothetical protein KGZ62_10265 [Sulfurimonas sp.]|nr:hypothetical protein [Sulfurimonas sp.]